MKKKIIFFCPSIEIGGVEKNLFKVVNFFAKKNKKVYLITFNKNISRKFHKKVQILNNNNIGNFNYPYFIKLFVCFINYFSKFGLKKNNTFVSFQSNLYFILLAKLTGNKIIARSNAAPNYYISNFAKKKLFQLIFGIADKIIVNSKDFQKNFYKTFHIKPVLIYNPAVKNSLLNKSSKKRIIKNSKIINFLNIGRLTYQKNQMLLLKAFNQINELKYRLIIIGNGSEEIFLKKYIKKNKMGRKIKIVKDMHDTKKYLNKSDVFILSSRFEGLPNVLIEAQIQKKFIISSNCPTGPREILLNGRAGYIFKNNNVLDLKNKILKYQQNKNSMEILNKIQIGFNNLNRFEENSNLNKYLREIDIL